MIQNSRNFTKFRFLKFIFCYQRKCPETLSTKEFVHGIVLQKFLMESEYFIFWSILHLLTMRRMNWYNYLKKNPDNLIKEKKIHSHCESADWSRFSGQNTTTGDESTSSQ